MDNAKPIFRWAGSKRQLIPKLMDFCNIEFKRYLEPFVGSGQLFFAINKKQSIISDINEDLICTYQTIATNTEKVHSLLATYQTDESNYYKIRSLNSSDLDEIERSARFVYLNRFCFNGLYRTNNHGVFNVPYAKGNKTSIPTLEEMLIVSKKLKNTKIICGDFEMVIKKNIQMNDLVYLDPPYAVANRKIFHQYDKSNFGINDLERIEDCLHFINKKGGFFVLSYAYCKEAIDIGRKWSYNKVKTQRNIAGFADHRKKAYEVIITNIN